MRRKARPSSAAETQLIYGEVFHAYKTARGWLWGQGESLLPGTSYPGYVGWIRRSDLSEIGPKPSQKIISVSAPVFTKANIKSPVKKYLALNSVVSGEINDKFVKTEHGYIRQSHVSPIGAPARHADWISVAESLIGQPYIWGGISSFGLDCSGLVQTALKAFGKDAPRDSDQQALIGEAVTITQDLSGLKRGDLIFWKGHVGIMTSPTRLLHANAHHMMVAAEPLITAAARIEETTGTITGIRRLQISLNCHFGAAKPNPEGREI